MFYWKYHFNSKICSLKDFAGIVSILVLLEVPLQQKWQKEYLKLRKRFNPCFTGSTTSTGYRGGSYIEIIEPFQSLFYWKYHFNYLKGLIQACKNEFQSLFYWKYHFNAVSPGQWPEQSPVSILVLLEVPLQLYRTVTRITLKQCFNPCFTGSTTSTIHTKRQAREAKMFQSLFYWKYHFNPSSL